MRCSGPLKIADSAAPNAGAAVSNPTMAAVETPESPYQSKAMAGKRARGMPKIIADKSK